MLGILGGLTVGKALTGLTIGSSALNFFGKRSELKAQRKQAFRTLDEMADQARASFGASGVSNPYVFQAINQTKQDINKASTKLLRAEGLKDTFMGLSELLKIQSFDSYQKSLSDLFKAPLRRKQI